MDTHAAHDSKSAISSDEESEMNHQQAFVDQTKVFEEMKLLLTTQQESLKHNLDVLQTKATTTTRGIKPTKVNNKKSTADNIGNNSQTNNVKVINTTITMLSDHHGENVTEHIDSGHGRQWSHSTATAISGKNREDIQICPICAAEFDDPENPGALEEHVAGHWSTDNN